MRHPRLTATCLTATLGLIGGLGVGCSTEPTPRVSHAPTYSFMQDPDARAEVDLWPALPGDAKSLAAAEAPE